jgi:hypothetical protein
MNIIIHLELNTDQNEASAFYYSDGGGGPILLDTNNATKIALYVMKQLVRHVKWGNDEPI